MCCDWEGNRRSGVALAMRHRPEWFIYLRAQGLSKGDEHPTNTLHGLWSHTEKASPWQRRTSSDAAVTILLFLRKVIRKCHDSVTYLLVSVMSGFCIKILARESKLQLAVNQRSLSGVAISGSYPPTY